MYKRYLEPNDESPITNYMNKRIKTTNINPNLRILNHNATTLKNEPDRDNVNESEIADGSVENDGLSPVENNLKTIDANTEDIFAAISDQLIHPNLQCTTLDAITMILAFFLQHHLTWTALEDILKLFHNILGDDSNLPKTKYFFKKFFGANQRTIIHFYCKKCMVYLNTYEGLKSQQKGKNDECEDTCIVCGTEYSLKKMNDGHFFMELPVREQIEKRVSEDISILDYNTKSSDSGNISDIFDGELYKSLRAKVGPVPLVTLTLNTDGVRVFKSKRKASLWPIQCIINEVPPLKRFKQDNIILCGIWFGPDPCFELYLKPLINEMNELDERKIVVSRNGTPVSITVRVLLFSADLPAKSKVLKFKQYNGEFGCNYCLHPGFLVGNSTSSKYTISSEDYTLRSHGGTLSLMRLFLSTGQSTFGVTGISPLVGFKDFDLINGSVIDYLHCLLEGISYLTLDLWFNSKNHREKYYITPRRLDEVNKNLKSIRPLKTFSIKPRLIEEKEYWKAHELKYWLLFYAAPCLHGILNPVYFNHLTLLSEAAFIYLKAKITPEELVKAARNVTKFHTDFQKLYGEENMVMNIHLLQHLKKCVQNCGPLWAYSNFNFESNNGSLVKHVHGTTDVEHQIASKYAFNNSLACLKKMADSTSSTLNYMERMKTMRIKKSEKIGHVTVFGSPHKHNLNSIEKKHLKSNLEYIMAYYKFFFGNDIFFSTTYKRAEQSDDTVVLLRDGRIGKISLIFKEEGTIVLLLKLLETEKVPHFPAHIRKLCKITSDRFEKVPAENILQKLLIITTTKGEFVSELPNQYEGD